MSEESSEKPRRPRQHPRARAIAPLGGYYVSTCSVRLAWDPDLDPSWPSPRGQRPSSNGFYGSRVGLLGTKFQFAAERLLGRGRRGPGQLGLRGTLRGTGLGVGGGRTGLGTGRQMFHQDSKATSHPLWKRHRARLLSSCPTRVDTEGRGPLHPHPPERARSEAAGGGEKGFKRKKNRQKIRSGGAGWRGEKPCGHQPRPHHARTRAQPAAGVEM